MRISDLTGDEQAVLIRCLSIESSRQKQLADLEATKRNCDHEVVKHHMVEHARIASVKEKLQNAIATTTTAAAVAGTAGATVANTTKTRRRYTAAAGDRKVRP